MDFEQKEKNDIIRNEDNFHFEDLRIIREFSRKLILEMNSLVKGIVIFGSNSKIQTAKKNSDIDIMIILDNITTFVTDELREAYKIIVGKLIDDIGNDKIHLMTINFSDYFDMVRRADPLILNVLRTGVIIYDTNTIEPYRYLLDIGKVKPSRETIYNYQSRAETLLIETKKHIEESILDLYYAAVDMIHSTLILENIFPPSPKEMPKIVKTKLKKHPELQKHFETIDELYNTAKNIEHKKTIDFNGKLYDNLFKKTKKLITEFKKYNTEKLKTKIDNLEI